METADQTLRRIPTFQGSKPAQYKSNPKYFLRMASLLAKLQRRVRRYPALVQLVRSTRNVLHFGPWRAGLLAYLRLRSPAKQERDCRSSILASRPDLPAALSSLEVTGYFAGLSIRREVVESSRPFWQDKEPGIYVDVHQESEPLSAIARDAQIVGVVRAYFGCEPNMIECKLFVSKIGRVDQLSSAFHFDHGGVRSLNVMVYLTDVDGDSGPHVLVSRTHRGKKLRDFFREFHPIVEIERRYPERSARSRAPQVRFSWRTRRCFIGAKLPGSPG